MGREYWQTIRDALSAEIAAGQLLPGAQLPTETALCQKFSAGRHSVRRAVAAMAIDGQLRIEQGRGTFVQSAPLINYHIGRRTRFRQNLLDQGVQPAGEHIGDQIVPASARIASALAIAPGDMVHRLVRRGLADGLPISIGISYHSAVMFPDMAEARRAGKSVTQIFHDHGIADYFRKSTVVFTRRPTAEEAGLLMQHPDQPVIVVQKTDMDPAGHPIGHSEAIWAGSRVQFTFDGLDDGGKDA